MSGLQVPLGYGVEEVFCFASAAGKERCWEGKLERRDWEALLEAGEEIEWLSPVLHLAPIGPLGAQPGGGNDG